MPSAQCKTATAATPPLATASGPLCALATAGEFVARHIGPTPEEQQSMLRLLGCASLDALIAQVVPEGLRLTDPIAVPAAASEAEVLAELKALADRNQVLRSYIGCGYHNTHTPSVILRNLLENPAWYTAYTPYQPEISQGRLEALLNFQTMIADLTGLPLANASLLDEATAAAEAMTFCQRVNRKQRGQRFFVDQDCHPQTIAVVQGRAEPLGIEVVVGAPETAVAQQAFGVLLQYPGSSGALHDPSALIAELKSAGSMVVMAADLLALTLLTPPGELGADVAVGSSQRFGVPLFFGGPHAAFMATHEAHARSLPGRLVGVSKDARGRPAYRLALQTREQHIRREKATSNICTAQALLAVTASMYAVYHGPDGLRRIAERVHRSTAVLAAGLAELGYALENSTYFDTLTVLSGRHTAALHAASVAAGINLRRVDATRVGVALDETVGIAELEALLSVFATVAGHAAVPVASLDSTLGEGLIGVPARLQRRSAYLQHPVFHAYRSETEMLRYLRRLADRDLALDRAMIPLGSCTMKLNAATEMLPISWPGFAQIHPFAPADQTRGYQQLLGDLERMLCAVTGYQAVSLQPNAGAQGEYAGLLAIRAWHRSRGEHQRDVCLIPSSAHGTNPASAQMANLRVVVVACDRDGNVDVDDLRAKAEQHSERLAALMITYPSTHGVFEAEVRSVCDIVHAHGGQVYIDGANLNALVGTCPPGAIGGDVSHLNLHKTFCIPHGGGGPGVGPIGVAAHLAPFLPGHPALATGVADAATRAQRIAPVSAAPYGSAGILPISWAYIRLMGGEGLRRATEVAILSANYIAARLVEHYPILYTGGHGRVAHECIIDTRPLRDSAGIGVEDIAKRLIDYGFHAPTMSFPVAGTLMIEPTESESLAEIDRFCEAMIAIRHEIAAIERGEADPADNPLVNAPHTLDALVGDWPHGYSRRQAVFPVEGLRADKYWAPVARVDNVYGDRNLICACPPPSAYAEPGSAPA